MATAPPPRPLPPPLPAVRRRVVSASRRFPPGCGCQHGNAAPPPRRPVPTPYAANGDPPPNPSWRGAPKTSSTPAAARFPGSKGNDRGGADGLMAGTMAPAAAEVVVRRLSAVRRYPPGCGRGVIVPKQEASVVAREGDGGAIELLAAACDVEAQAIAGDREEVVPSASTLEHGEATNSDCAGKCGGDGGGAPEGCGSPGPPCEVAAIVLAPLVLWAQHGQRSQQRRKTF